jgi:hypothetical protein
MPPAAIQKIGWPALPLLTPFHYVSNLVDVILSVYFVCTCLYVLLIVVLPGWEWWDILI